MCEVSIPVNWRPCRRRRVVYVLYVNVYHITKRTYAVQSVGVGHHMTTLSWYCYYIALIFVSPLLLPHSSAKGRNLREKLSRLEEQMMATLGSLEEFQQVELMRQTRIMEVERQLARYQAEVVHPQRNVSYLCWRGWRRFGQLWVLVGAEEKKGVYCIEKSVCPIGAKLRTC